ncbi:hypothetical protein ISCGN_025703 [Ixodes scapularis]
MRETFVPPQQVCARKPLVAQCAHEGPLARVFPRVARQVGLVRKRARAELALEGPLPRVPPHVHREDALDGERFATETADEAPLLWHIGLVLRELCHPSLRRLWQVECVPVPCGVFCKQGWDEMDF